LDLVDCVKIAGGDLEGLFVQLAERRTSLLHITGVLTGALHDARVKSNYGIAKTLENDRQRARNVAETVDLKRDVRSVGLFVYARLAARSTRAIRAHLALLFAHLAWIRVCKSGFLLEHDGDFVLRNGCVVHPALSPVISFLENHEAQRRALKESGGHVDVVLVGRLKSMAGGHLVYVLLIGQAEVPYPYDPSSSYWLAFIINRCGNTDSTNHETF
jgi:hypothetical protein